MLRGLGFDVAVSHDAGRYLCNYIFYHSLRQCAARPQQSLQALFVHVPSFDTVPVDTQLLFVVAVINAVTAAISAAAPAASFLVPAPIATGLVA